MTYASRVVGDHQLFRSALARLGPSLGIVRAADDGPAPDFAALLGVPAVGE